MMSNVTVVIPTYNRPADLARLLRYLRSCASSLPIVVLDSSRADVVAENRRVCATTGLVIHQTYTSDIVFYDKVLDGLGRFVTTPFVCLCADDDLVVPAAIAKAAALLEHEPDVSVAHGYYAQFSVVGGARLTGFAYGGAEIVDEVPLRRVAEVLLRYEATLYAVQRTELLRAVVGEAAKAPSLLSGELLTTVLALARGKARRVPLFTHARNIAPSHSFSNWHPAEALSVDPKSLVMGLAYVRNRLTAHVPAASEADLRLFDFAALAYVSEFVRPSTARKLARMAIDGRSERELRDAGMSDFAASLQASGAMAALRGSAAARWLKSALASNHALRERLLRLARTGARPVAGLAVTLPDGRAVKVAFEAGFTTRLGEIRSTLGDPVTQQLADAMALYCDGYDAGGVA